VTPERVEKVRMATSIVEKELTSSKIFQVLAVLLNDKATGMLEGKRHFGDIIAVRAVESKDALTARPYKITWSKLEKVRDRILKEVPGVVKVMYDVTSKPPSTIEYI